MAMLRRFMKAFAYNKSLSPVRGLETVRGCRFGRYITEIGTDCQTGPRIIFAGAKEDANTASELSVDIGEFRAIVERG